MAPDSTWQDIENQIKEFYGSQNFYRHFYNDQNLNDFVELAKKRGTLGACFLPDPFGHIVQAKDIRRGGNYFSVLFATESYCYSISYMYC